MREIDSRALRQRILLRWLNRILFFISLLGFLAIALNPIYTQMPGQSFTMVMWFVLVVLHGLWAFGILGNWMRRQMEREAERLRAQGYTVHLPETGAEKPKRAARLVDDGEVEYEDDEAGRLHRKVGYDA